MRKRKQPIDTTRASRDGHEYHEAWTARMALQLLRPGIELKAIAVEGFSLADQQHASLAATDIADITLYYGHETFEQATRKTVTQFKYSIADKNTDFRASHAKKTISKFAKAYLDHKNKYGAQAVKNKLDFDLITNRPIYKPLQQAIQALAKGLSQTKQIKEQAKQLEAASGFTGELLAEFAAKLRIVSATGNLSAINNEVARLIIDWSATNDALASARLRQLRKLVRDKAGDAGACRNLITRVDILAALSIADADDLLPCKSAIPDVGKVVQREQLASTIALIPHLQMPLLIHASGSVGKTVFMDSLASALSESCEAVFFDCFGGGSYRSPEDARHQPKKGLIHIANTLAFRGLCDPMLPDSTDTVSLLNTFRRRLVQCVNTLNLAMPKRELVLFIDAIDNAELFAHSRSEDAFPICMLESLHYASIPGMKLIVSCRTERKPDTYAHYESLELDSFNLSETQAYLNLRLSNISTAEIKIAQARSAGNPRVLDYLVKSKRGLLDESEIDKKLILDDLIQQRISEALALAIERGYTQQDIDTFLAGLAVLPPPVPLDEYAGANGMQLSEIESFVADLTPLLERTNQGLMFRDEPTETLIRSRYASSIAALRRVATKLFARQDTSVYAARALPNLLHQLDDGEQLFKLAFDERIPQDIKSTVGKRNVRYSRIKVAVLHAAIKCDYNRLVQLLLELSTLAVVDQRGAIYIHDYPDLVVAARDVDAMRRLFENRIGWQGARHARLLIANCLSGDSEEAYRHAHATDEWLNHYRRTDSDDMINRMHPEHPDVAAIPFFHICEGRAKEAARFLQGWHAWHAFEIGAYIFGYFQLAKSLRQVSPKKLAAFVSALENVGSLAAALAFYNNSKSSKRNLVTKLSKVCLKYEKIEKNNSHGRDHTYKIQDGLRKASALALSLNMVKEALIISRYIPCQRPGLWSLRDSSYHNDIFPFIFQIALEAAANNKSLHESDILPNELVEICSSISRNMIGKEFRRKAKEELQKFIHNDHNDGEKQQGAIRLSHRDKQNAEQFFDEQLESLLGMTRALSEFLITSEGKLDIVFILLLKNIEDTRKKHDSYRSDKFNNFFRILGIETALFALWIRSELEVTSVEHFLEIAHAQGIGSSLLIQILSVIAQREPLHDLAGKQALKARMLIEREDDVTYRASLFASLARAMLPVSIDDAAIYFHNGLEQMDAIGSGDYEFTNELMLFASTIKENELDECDFHTLSSICELNIEHEPEKFYWEAYARGMSKAAGLRGLAKLTRWDDRAKIRLGNTLLPYLTALLDDGKIEPELALVLNCLAKPVEYRESGTKEFAEAIQRKVGAKQDVIAVLIKQFEGDNPRIPTDTTVGVLASLAKDTFGEESETTVYLLSAQKYFAKINNITNDHRNYHGLENALLNGQAQNHNHNHGNQKLLSAIVKSTDPSSRVSLTEAINELNKLHNVWDLKDELFAALRNKLPAKLRVNYIQDICELENFDYYWKLAELKMCRKTWQESSAALPGILKSLAFTLLRLHAGDLVNDGRLSGDMLKEISDLTGVTIDKLTLELIKIYSRPGISVSGSVWLAFGSFVSSKADDGQGQIALKKLLESDAAKLANNAVDGVWQAGLYPDNDTLKITHGLIWCMLGSPYAENRWRAAHSIRCLAKFGKWNIIDSLVNSMDVKDADPFQARELIFSFLSAKLWLLIALARLALDYPKEIARYKVVLLRIVVENENPHVLMRHFSSRALLACIDVDHLILSIEHEKLVRSVDLSPYPRLKEKIRKGEGFYHGRPESSPKPTFDFYLDYDFQKHDVDNLSSVFGKPCWEVSDMISGIAHELDSSASGMSEGDNRRSPSQHNFHGMSTHYHSYGQQLGWHAMFFAAGKLLKNYPVTNDWWCEDDPWGEWLGRYLLTRKDGLWLSDGTDRMPLSAASILLEKAKDGLMLTGDRDKLLQLVGITSSIIDKELIVEGYWHSADSIRVHISSALVVPAKAEQLALKLMQEDAMTVWLPTYKKDDENLEYASDKKHEYTPWIVTSYGESQLDEHDPFGICQANHRPYISHEFASKESLTRNDCFGRAWNDKCGKIAVHAEAWGYEDNYSEHGPYPGLRLLCSILTIKEILKRHDKELLLLISLQRSEKKSPQNSNEYTHTIGVVRVKQSLEFDFYSGAVSEPYTKSF